MSELILQSLEIKNFRIDTSSQQRGEIPFYVVRYGGKSRLFTELIGGIFDIENLPTFPDIPHTIVVAGGLHPQYIAQLWDRIVLTRHYQSSWYTMLSNLQREDAMGKFDAILQNEHRLQAMTGFDQELFAVFLPHFTQAMEAYLAHTTLDGYMREGERAITYANSPLPTAEDRLLFILTYLKQNPIQQVQGQLFGMTQSNVSKWVHLLLDILLQALAAQDVLPARTPQDLAAYLEQNRRVDDPEAPPFFATMVPNDQ